MMNEYIKALFTSILAMVVGLVFCLITIWLLLGLFFSENFSDATSYIFERIEIIMIFYAVGVIFDTYERIKKLEK